MIYFLMQYEFSLFHIFAQTKQTTLCVCVCVHAGLRAWTVSISFHPPIHSVSLKLSDNTCTNIT